MINAESLLQNDNETVAVCGVDLYPREISIPVYKTFSEIQEEADVIIDFSSAENLKERLEYAKAHKLAIVLASTGFSQSDLAMIEEYAKEIAIFRTANLSLGVNVMQALCKAAAQILGDAFDVEIIEKHHNLKKDAPSGTALMLADSVNEAFENTKTYVNGRNGIVGARTKKEIGIHAVRMGNVVGEHEVIIGTDTQTLTLKHEAHSRSLFAEGAITAAAFMVGKGAGLYTLSDLIREQAE